MAATSSEPPAAAVTAKRVALVRTRHQVRPVTA